MGSPKKPQIEGNFDVEIGGLVVYTAKTMIEARQWATDNTASTWHTYQNNVPSKMNSLEKYPEYLIQEILELLDENYTYLEIVRMLNLNIQPSSLSRLIRVHLKRQHNQSSSDPAIAEEGANDQ